MPTIKDEIAAIAVENGYEGAEPSTVKDAVIALADTLAGEDAGSVATIADAIVVLAPYVTSGGGGGGATVGSQVVIYLWTDMANAPAANDSVPSEIYDVCKLALGDNTIVAYDEDSSFGPFSTGIASGVTVTTYWMPPITGDNGANGYVATIDSSGDVPVFATVSAWDGIITKEDGTGDHAGQKRYTYTVPELANGEVFVLQYANDF